MTGSRMIFETSGRMRLKNVIDFSLNFMLGIRATILGTYELCNFLSSFFAIELYLIHIFETGRQLTGTYASKNSEGGSLSCRSRGDYIFFNGRIYEHNSLTLPRVKVIS